MKSSNLRFLIATVLLASAAVFLQAHSRSEIVPARMTLNLLPSQLGPWSGTDLSIDSETLQVLGPGDFLLREYRDDDSPRSVADLFIAYFPSQRVGDTIHSPKNCLPGSGWTPIQNRKITLSLPGHTPFPANRYVIVKGDARSIVLYWYWAHDRGLASEYVSKYYQIADSVRMHRSDGALVRISSPMNSSESPEEAEHRLLPFAGQLLPLLGQYIPR